MYSLISVILTLTSITSYSLAINKSSNCLPDWVHAQTEGCFKFLFSDTNVSWFEAHHACEREGGYLAEPKTIGQMEFLTGIAALQESFYGIKFWWISLDDIGLEGAWTWQHSRQKATQSFWGEGSPSEEAGNNMDCALVELTEDHLDWKDQDCSARSVGFFPIAPICQRDARSPDQTTTTSSSASSVTTTSPITSRTGGCPAGWSEFQGKYFLLIEQHMSWIDARQKCHSLGADLASIHSKDEDGFIQNLLKTLYADTNHYGKFWIGATDSQTEGTWTWTDGSLWDYESRYPRKKRGGPHINCLVTTRYGEWTDYVCGVELRFLCKTN